MDSARQDFDDLDFQKIFRRAFYLEGSVCSLRAILHATRIRMEELRYSPIRNGSLEKALALLETWGGHTPGPTLEAKLRALKADVEEEYLYCMSTRQESRESLISVVSYCLNVALTPGIEHAACLCRVTDIRASALSNHTLKKHPHPRTFWFVHRGGSLREEFDYTSFFSIRESALKGLTNALEHLSRTYWGSPHRVLQALLSYKRPRTQVPKAVLDTMSPTWAVAWDQVLEHATAEISLKSTVLYEDVLHRAYGLRLLERPCAAPILYLAVVEQLPNLPTSLRDSIWDLLGLDESSMWRRIETPGG